MENYNEIEREKYNNAWSDKGYTGTSQRDFFKWIDDYSQTHIIDFGCGRAQMRDMWRWEGKWNYQDYVGIDISDKAIKRAIKNAGSNDKFFCWPLDGLNFDDKERKDLRKKYTGYCTDVMEHIHPEHLDSILFSISKHCKECYFTIALFPHRYKGMELHLSLFSQEMWEKTISRYFIIKRIDSIKSTHLYIHAKSK